MNQNFIKNKYLKYFLSVFAPSKERIFDILFFLSIFLVYFLFALHIYKWPFVDKLFYPDSVGLSDIKNRFMVSRFNIFFFISPFIQKVPFFERFLVSLLQAANYLFTFKIANILLGRYSKNFNIKLLAATAVVILMGIEFSVWDYSANLELNYRLVSAFLNLLFLFLVLSERYWSAILIVIFQSFVHPLNAFYIHIIFLSYFIYLVLNKKINWKFFGFFILTIIFNIAFLLYFKPEWGDLKPIFLSTSEYFFVANKLVFEWSVVRSFRAVHYLVYGLFFLTTLSLFIITYKQKAYKPYPTNFLPFLITSFVLLLLPVFGALIEIYSNILPNFIVKNYINIQLPRSYGWVRFFLFLSLVFLSRYLLTFLEVRKDYFYNKFKKLAIVINSLKTNRCEERFGIFLTIIFFLSVWHIIIKKNILMSQAANNDYSIISGVNNKFSFENLNLSYDVFINLDKTYSQNTDISSYVSIPPLQLMRFLNKNIILERNQYQNFLGGLTVPFNTNAELASLQAFMINNNEDGLWVVLPHMNDFRRVFQKPVYFINEDLGLLQHDKDMAQRILYRGELLFGKDFWKKYNIYCSDPNLVLTKKYLELKEKDFLKIKLETPQLKFIVTYALHSLPFPILYKNNVFVVYYLAN